MDKYTIQTVMPTGQVSPMYGTEFHVKFAENEGTFKLWYKTAPTEGQVQEGTIDGWKFKKAKKEWDGNSGNVSSNAGGAGSASVPPSTTGTTKYQKPAYKDNSDGMRKGMAINNAATYVNLISPEPLAPKDWAKAVTAYARELYLVSELDSEAVEADKEAVRQVVEEVTIAEAPKSVQEVFGIKASPVKAVPPTK